MDERHTFQLTGDPGGADISSLALVELTYVGPRKELIGRTDAAAVLEEEGFDRAEFRILNADGSDRQT